jgi:hypothetical protein
MRKRAWKKIPEILSSSLLTIGHWADIVRASVERGVQPKPVLADKRRRR